MYASRLLNRLPTTMIGGKTPLEICSGGAAHDHDSLRIFDCPAYVDVKKDMLDSNANKLVFLRCKENLKGSSYRIQKTRNLSKADMSRWMRLRW